MGSLTKTSVGVLIALVLQNTSLVFAMKYAYRASAKPFNASVVVATSEALKLSISVVIVLYQRKVRVALGKNHWLKSCDLQMAIPSLLYIVQSNLLFIAVNRLNPTVYLACLQSKIMTTAFFSYLLLGTKLRWKQIISLLALTVGMVLVQFPSPSNAPGKATHFSGLIAVLGASITSGYAGVFLERLYKTSENNVSIFDRNIQLAVFAFPLAVIWSMKDFQVVSLSDYFQGFDGVIACVIFLHAVGGLLVAAVMKFASSILKCYAVAASICLSVVISCHFGLQDMSYALIAGMSLVICSVFLYTSAVDLKTIADGSSNSTSGTSA